MSSFYSNTSFLKPAIVSSSNEYCNSILEENSNYHIKILSILPVSFKNKKDIAKIINDSLESEYQIEGKKILFPFFTEKNDYLHCNIEVFLNTKLSFREIKKVFFKESRKFRCIDINKIVLSALGEETVPYLPEVHLDASVAKTCDSWKGLTFEERLLKDSNYLMNESPYKRYYGIESQIRLILSSLKSAIDSGGKRMTHSVLFGPPACGKTSVLNTLEEIVGKHNVLKLDAPATTKAGIEKLFLNSNIPPIVILEEAEKANEDWLRSWLSLLDERSEIRKVNHKETIVKDIDILFYCTVNDSEKFNDLLDGALASRCKNKIYFPRPSEETVKRILIRDVQENGGKIEWVEPALQLAKDLNIDDPRVIISFLSGGDRLLDGSYQKDKKNCLENSIL